MGLMNALRAVANVFARSSQPARNPDRSLVPLYQRTAAGVPMSPDRAMRNAVVWACVRYIAQTIAALPWQVRVYESVGRFRVSNDGMVPWLLGEQASEELSAFQFRETLLTHALLWGNGYAEIERDGAGRPMGLHVIHPSRVTPERQVDGAGALRLVYTVAPADGGTGTVTLAARDVFHLRGFGDDVVGVSVVALAAQSIGWAEALELFGASFFGNGLVPSGIVEGAGGLDQNAMDRLKRELRRVHGGPRNSFNPLILDSGITWKPTGVKPNEGQFVETAQFQIEQICRWFGVPPHKVAHLLRSTNNNIEHQSIEVVQDCITPWCKRLEEEADRKLIGSRRQGTVKTQIDIAGLRRGDMKAQAEFLKSMLDLGVMSINEARGLIGLNPLDDGGDVILVQVNRQTLDRAMAGLPVEAAASTPEPSQPAEDEPPVSATVHQLRPSDMRAAEKLAIRASAGRRLAHAA